MNLRKIIREEMDDFTWVKDEPINPWLQYSMIVFDVEPTRKEINDYIELALNTGRISNKEAWETGREQDITGILEYIRDYGGTILKIDQWGNLQYADISYYNSSHNSIKYSQLVGKNLNESDDSLEWINDIKPALNQDQEWILVNDVNPNNIEEGIKIQKYLFNLGYKWFSSELIKDTIYSIHHFPSKGLRGDLTYYNNKENERELADKEIERNNNVYYWSQIKADEINESDEDNPLQWIKDIVPTPKNPQKGLIYQFYNYPDSLYNENIKTDNIIITAVVDDRVYFDTVDRYWTNHPSDPGSDIMDKKAFSRMVNSGEIKYIGPSRVNESKEDDPLQWIKDQNPIPHVSQLKVGDEFAYIHHDGTYMTCVVEAITNVVLIVRTYGHPTRKDGHPMSMSKRSYERRRELGLLY